MDYLKMQTSSWLVFGDQAEKWEVVEALMKEARHRDEDDVSWESRMELLYRNLLQICTRAGHHEVSG